MLVVEHDEDTMYAADQIIDIGPGAGVHGGKVMAQGTAEEVKLVTRLYYRTIFKWKKENRSSKNKKKTYKVKSNRSKRCNRK